MQIRLTGKLTETSKETRNVLAKFKDKILQNKSIVNLYAFKIHNSRFKIQDSRFKIQDSEFKIQDPRSKIQDPRFQIQDWAHCITK